MLWNPKEHFHEVVGLLDNQYRPCSRLPHENQEVVDDYREAYIRGYEKYLGKKDERLCKMRREDPKRFNQAISSIHSEISGRQSPPQNNRAKKFYKELKEFGDTWTKFHQWTFEHFPPTHLWLPTPKNLEEKIHWLFENPLRYEQHTQYEWKSNWVKTDSRTKIRYFLDRFSVKLWYLVEDGVEKYDIVFCMQPPYQCHVDHYDYTSSSEINTLRDKIRQRSNFLGNAVPNTPEKRVQMKQRKNDALLVKEYFEDENTLSNEQNIPIQEWQPWAITPERYLYYGGKQAESILNYTWKRWASLELLYKKLTTEKKPGQIITL